MERDERTKRAVIKRQLLEWAKAQRLACPEHPHELKADPTDMRLHCGTTEFPCPWQAAAPLDIAAAVEAYARLKVAGRGIQQPSLPSQSSGISDFGKVCIGIIVALVLFFIAFYVMAEIKTPDSTIDIIGGKDIPDRADRQ